MGHHIDEDGNFKSDKFPWLPSGEMIVSLNEPEVKEALELCGIEVWRLAILPFSKATVRFSDASARIFLGYYASLTKDHELGEDIKTILETKHGWTDAEMQLRYRAYHEKTKAKGVFDVLRANAVRQRGLEIHIPNWVITKSSENKKNTRIDLADYK